MYKHKRNTFNEFSKISQDIELIERNNTTTLAKELFDVVGEQYAHFTTSGEYYVTQSLAQVDSESAAIGGARYRCGLNRHDPKDCSCFVKRLKNKKCKRVGHRYLMFRLAKETSRELSIKWENKKTKFCEGSLHNWTKFGGEDCVCHLRSSDQLSRIQNQSKLTGFRSS